MAPFYFALTGWSAPIGRSSGRLLLPVLAAGDAEFLFERVAEMRAVLVTAIGGNRIEFHRGFSEHFRGAVQLDAPNLLSESVAQGSHEASFQHASADRNQGHHILDRDVVAGMLADKDIPQIRKIG
jgi:hypothetical protein